MTDIQQAGEWVDADKVRAIVASLNAWAEDADAERAHGRALGYRTAAENLATLLPSPQPRPEDVPPGEPWSVRYWGKEWVGVRSDHHVEPWSLIGMDGLDYRDVYDSEVILMFRLVPEVYADG